MNKLSLSALALAMGLAGAAQAASVASIVNQYGKFQFEDDNGEMIVNNNGGNPNQLDVGDYLTGVIEITKILELDAPFRSAVLDGVTNEHLAAVFTTEVLTKTWNGASWDYTFGPVAGTQTIASFYVDNVDNLNILGCATDAACKAAVTDGTLVLELGFIGDADEFWVANGVPTDDLTVLDAAPGAAKFGFANFSLNVSGVNLLGEIPFAQSTCFTEPGELAAGCAGGGAPADGDNLVQFLNSTDILGGASSTAYQATSDADFTAEVIPEPLPLALAGLGLLSMFAAKRAARGKKA